jgi:hypothetical protein
MSSPLLSRSDGPATVSSVVVASPPSSSAVCLESGQDLGERWEHRRMQEGNAEVTSHQAPIATVSPRAGQPNAVAVALRLGTTRLAVRSDSPSHTV